jgi:3-oxoacid CoA-transferase subunit B
VADLPARERIAARVAADLRDGWYVNLGLGMPTLVAAAMRRDPGKEVLFHSENGLLGLGGTAPVGLEDPDLCDANKSYTTLCPGGAAFDSALSFAMVRGGHIDVAVLGALQVDRRGDLANWHVPGRNPGVGGAMDLVVGARRVWVVMDQFDKAGRPKLVDACTLPLTGSGVVDRVYTELATYAIRDGGVWLVDRSPGVTLEMVLAALPFEVAGTAGGDDPIDSGPTQSTLASR